MAERTATLPAEGAGTYVAAADAHGLRVVDDLDFHGVGKLKIFAVLEHEMIDMHTLAQKESVTLGVFWWSFGALLSAVLGLFLSFPVDPLFAGCYIGTTVALGLCSIASCLHWLATRSGRSQLIAAIRERASTPVSLQVASPATHRQPPDSSTPTPPA